VIEPRKESQIKYKLSKLLRGLKENSLRKQTCSELYD
jgi:hypothetical protein